jgi:hypothetical protein
VTLPGAEFRERHAVGAADARIVVVHAGREAVGGEPFALGVGIEKRFEDPLGGL